MHEVVIKVRHNGPYKVTGPVTLIDADGNEYDIGEPGRADRRCAAAVARRRSRSATHALADRLRGGRAGGGARTRA